MNHSRLARCYLNEFLSIWVIFIKYLNAITALLSSPFYFKRAAQHTRRDGDIESLTFPITNRVSTKKNKSIFMHALANDSKIILACWLSTATVDVKKR